MSKTAAGGQRSGPMLERVPSPGMRFPKRHHLYVWVWLQPVSRVAAELGMSGPALRKRCVKLKIPTPSRGYWAQRKIGVRLPVTPLPDPDDDKELDLEVSEQRFEFLDKLPYPPEAPALGETAQGGAPELGADLGTPHRLPVAEPERIATGPSSPGAQESNRLGEGRRIAGASEKDALGGDIPRAERQLRLGLPQHAQIPIHMIWRLQEQARKLRDVEQALQELAVETAAISAMR